MSNRVNEALWKNEFVQLAWTLFRSGKMSEAAKRALIMRVRNSCDECARPMWSEGDRNCKVDLYQCCWIRNEHEDHVAMLCDECHQKREELRPHPVISV